ncbi:response regulator [Acidobacteria bacterium AH-259-O06]|nr:response regulator [Acidobacteria bacterium AH-259-G07]MDA2930605.1 response regulator [Acidobacteria bacterium AH-259-O06]
MCRALTLLLRHRYSVQLASSGEEGLRKAVLLKPDLVLLDLKFPETSGIAVLRALKEKTREEISVIVLTAYGKVQSAVQAIKLEAVDYLEKPFDNERLRREIDRFFAAKRFPKEVPIRNQIIGESPPMHRVWELIERSGPTDIPILLQAETGTGKELFARATHEISKRSQGPSTVAGFPTSWRRANSSDMKKGPSGGYSFWGAGPLLLYGSATSFWTLEITR